MRIKEIISTYEKGFPRANAHSRVLLKVLTGDLFREKLYEYALPLLEKGVPPFITDLKADIYSDAEKTQILQEMLDAHLVSMENT